MLSDKFEKRFAELEAQSQGFAARTSAMVGTYYETADYLGWAAAAQSLIRAVFGEASPHYTNFISTLEKCKQSNRGVNALKAVFLSAKEAFNGGYVFSPELTISGEVFGDFVAMAKQALSGGHKNVASVLACAALEDALKRYMPL